MGVNDGGVQVRFSVANAEVVRQALAQLGKDGEKALRQLDSSAAAVNPRLQALSDIIDVSKGRVQGYAAQAGFVGQIIGRWGPAGLGAAAGIGAAFIALDKLNQISTEYVEKAKRIRDVATTLQLTSDQVQTLGRAGSRAGVDFDELTGGLGKFASAMDEVRRRQGDLFEAARRVNPELALQLSATKDNATALEILTRILDRAGTSETALARAAFGKGGLELPRALADLMGRGGLNTATAADTTAGKNIAEQQIDNLRKARQEIDQIYSAANKIFGEVFSPTQLGAQRELAQLWGFIADKVKQVSDTNVSGGIWDWLASKLPSSTRDRIGLSDYPDEAGRRPRSFDPNVPQPRARPEGLQSTDDDRQRSIGELNTMRERITLLGAAATQDEQYTLREKELAVAVALGKGSQQDANRSLAALRLAQDQVTASTRERLGIITEEQMMTARLAELNDLRARNVIKNEREMAEAVRVARKEVEENRKAMEVRVSDFPNLTRFRQEAFDTRAAIDRGIVDGLEAANRSFVDFELGTKKGKAAWNDFVQNFGRGVLEMVNKRLILGPIAQGLEGLVKSLAAGMTGGSSSSSLGFASPTARAADGMVFERFANGGSFTNRIFSEPTPFRFRRGGSFALGEMGEDGDEAVIPLRRGRGGRLGVDASGFYPERSDRAPTPVMVNVNVENTTDARVQVSQRPSGGNMNIDILVEQVEGGIARNVTEGRGPMNEALLARGLTPKFA